MKRATTLLLAALGLFATLGAASADDSALFPFVIEKGAPENITNVQTWDKPAPFAGRDDGFLYNNGGVFAAKTGKKRLLGTNFCFGASFTTKEKAERVAESLSRFGIGVVRLHHMDSRDIWGKNFEKGTTEIDPEKLDRLDYLIYCFHKKGIFVNINLHVSRAFREIDGFENASQLPTQNKGVDNFDRKMIEYQKKYAKDLLQHVNPYTKLAYVDDPGVAVVEINNENSVVASWAWGQLDDLPKPYSDEFRALWNGWLSKKYGSTEKLRAAWKCETRPLGENMIPSGFGDGFLFKEGWRLETDGASKSSYQIVPAAETGIDAPALRFEVEKMGDVAWRPQFGYAGLAVKKGSPYLVRFKIRADETRKLRTTFGQAHEPWSQVGFSTEIEATPEWKTVELAFIAPEDDALTRLYFGGFQDGLAFELADVSVQEGGTIGLAEDLKLEDGAILVPSRSGAPNAIFTAEATGDFSDFLYELENDYWQEMFAYVKELGTKSPITGTQLQYGFWHNQARLDYCDIHAYWNHPNFPRRQWDGNDWLVGNSCLANSPSTGTLASLASLRVLGKPFTCSEYDHPYPNQYCAEGNVMLAAVAAFQDWGATFQFAWSHGDDFDREAAGSFFDECSNSVKIAHLPACYGMFVRGDVKSGPGEFYYAPKMSEEKELEIMRSSLTGYHRSISGGLGIDKSLSLAVYSGVDLPEVLGRPSGLDKAKPISSWSDLPERCGSEEKKEIVNEFGEITWNWQKEGKGFFTVDAANAKVFSGFVAEPRAFDGLTLDVGKTRLGWATVSLVKAKGAIPGAEKVGKLTPGSYLLTATGLMRNTDEKLVSLEGNNVTTAGHFGGSPGRAPVLCEGVPATIDLANLSPDAVEVWALNNRGDRAERIDVEQSETGARFAIGPERKTIWYEIDVK